MPLMVGPEATEAETPQSAPMDSHDAIADNLKAFNDNLHSKASQLISWIGNVESMTPQTDRHTKPPGPK